MVTDPATYTLNKLAMFFKNEHIISAIIEAQKLENISVSFLQFLGFEGSMDQNLWVHFKNLMFFVHQNCLLLYRFLLERLPALNKTNSWAKKLNQISERKLTKLCKTKAEILQALKISNET